MKLLVTGSSGLIGRELTRRASEKHVVYSASHESAPDYGEPVKLDITKEEDVRSCFSRLAPDAVIHLAALTDVERCEADEELAMRLNFHASQIIAKEAARVGAFLLYVSTDYVFDGEKGLYRENDRPGPVNAYGLSKLKGEEAVREYARDWCIARTSTPYGFHPKRKTFPEFVAERLLGGEEVKALVDQHTSPAYVPNLAEMLLEIAEARMPGLIHAAGATRISRYDAALKLAERLGLNGDKIVKASLFEMNWRARRPRDSSLSVELAASSLKAKPLGFEDGLELFVQKMAQRLTKGS